jgi:hypothetical protein
MFDLPVKEDLFESYAEGFGVILPLYFVMLLLTCGASIAAYILQSVGFYQTAVRRGLRNPWLAWVPVGNVWILGSISDQYQYIVQRKNKNKRKALMILNILMWVAYAAIWGILVSMIVNAISFSNHMPDETWYALVGHILGMIVAALVMLGLAVAVAVIQYMALYDYYRSCDPNNAVMYLVLGILATLFMPALAILQSVFIFLCRNKDLGMPPRKDAVCAAQEIQLPPAGEPSETEEV